MSLAVGQPVRVLARFPPGHVRTPYYIRGKIGTIERLLAAYPNPEECAYGRSDSPKQMLYRVRFFQAEIWPDYSGSAGDTVDIEIYEHWLEPVAAETTHG